MNVYDNEGMADVLSPIGFAAVGTRGNADLPNFSSQFIAKSAAAKIHRN